ncbi:hypothetical protein OROHE_010123 [Orobanche hederae]
MTINTCGISEDITTGSLQYLFYGHIHVLDSFRVHGAQNLRIEPLPRITESPAMGGDEIFEVQI